MHKVITGSMQHKTCHIHDCVRVDYKRVNVSACVWIGHGLAAMTWKTAARCVLTSEGGRGNRTAGVTNFV